MRRALLTLGLLLSATLAQAQPVRPTPRWFRYYLPIRPQLVPGSASSSGGTFTGGALSVATTLNDDIPLAFGSAADATRPAILFDTAETVDTGMLLTGSVSNHWVIAENGDKAFDFAHAAATDPTLFIHSHNQNTTQWLGLAHDGTNGVISVGTGRLTVPAMALIEGAANNAAAGWSTGATGIYRIGSSNFAISQSNQLRFAIGAAKNLTESAATTVITLAGAAGTYDGGSLEYNVSATDTTDFQSRTGKVYWAYVNKAATETCVITGFDGTANPTELKDSSGTGAMSSGTLTYAWAVDTSGANNCLLTLNAVSSLTQTILQISVTQVNRGALTTVTLTP